MKYLIVTGISLLLLYLAYKTYNYFMPADGLATKIRDGAIILDGRTAAE